MTHRDDWTRAKGVSLNIVCSLSTFRVSKMSMSSYDWNTWNLTSQSSISLFIHSHIVSLRSCSIRFRHLLMSFCYTNYRYNKILKIASLLLWLICYLQVVHLFARYKAFSPNPSLFTYANSAFAPISFTPPSYL